MIISIPPLVFLGSHHYGRNLSQAGTTARPKHTANERLVLSRAPGFWRRPIVIKFFAIELESIRFFIITTSNELTLSCLRLLRRLVKPPEPGADSIEFGVVDPIDAGTASLLVRKQSRLFQDTEVPARSGPGTTKAPHDLAGSHVATAEPDYEKNVTPRGMGQSGEDLFCFR